MHIVRLHALSASTVGAASGQTRVFNLLGTATVRLSGAVDMRRLATNNEITFDCIFVGTFR